MAAPTEHNEPIKAGQLGVGFLVNHTARAFQCHMSKDLAQHSLTTEGYTVLRHVLRETESGPEGISAEELSVKILMPAVEIRAAAVRLERDGWLTISGSGANATYLPTAGAHKVVPLLYATSRWMLETALNGFSRDEIDDLQEYLTRILKNLGAPLGEDEGPLEPA